MASSRRTQQDERLRIEYPIGGNYIWVRSVNLDQEFRLIKEELEGMLRTWVDRVVEA